MKKKIQYFRKGRISLGKERTHGAPVDVWNLGNKCTVCVAVSMRMPARFKQSFLEEPGGRSAWEDRVGRKRPVCKP